MTTPKRRQRAKEHFWRRMLRLWQASGLTVRDFCAHHQLTQASFYFWRRTIAQRDQEAANTSAAPDLPDREPSHDAPPVFVPVDVATINHIPTSTAGQPLELVLDSGVLVRVPVGFDETTLRQLLGLLDHRQTEGSSC